MMQSTGRCHRCGGDMYHDGDCWRHSVNGLGSRECPPAKTLHQVIEDAIWQALDSEQGMPHSGVDPAYVIPEFLRLLGESGYAVVTLSPSIERP